jgi:hypothetical protein
MKILLFSIVLQMIIASILRDQKRDGPTKARHAILAAISMIVLMTAYEASSTPPSFYTVLGVSPHATSQAIKRAYKTLAKNAHPDKNQGDPNAMERFIRISRAYEVLSSSAGRAVYDSFGEKLYNTAAKRPGGTLEVKQRKTLGDHIV